MKKPFFLILAIQLLLINSQLTQAQSVSLTQGSYTGATFSVTTPDLITGTRTVDGEKYIVLSFEGATHLFREGEPDLPIISQMIDIPLCTDVQVSVCNIQTRNILNPSNLYNLPNGRILPMQPAPSKSDKGPRPFVLDSTIYSTDAFYAAPEVAWVDFVGTARDRNLATLRISPVSYNPVTGEVQLITSMTVTLKYKGVDEAATRLLHERYYSPAFSVGNNVIATMPAERKSVRNAAPLHYLIVAHSSFRGALDDFVAWKKRQGFIVSVAYTGDATVGTSSTSIANYIKGYYTNATDELPAPTYLLLVGDHQQIPAFDSRCTNPANDHVSDLYYVTWTEGDNVPDCYMGRFSARNLAELTPQIEKTIFYESYAFTDDSYLGHGVLIAGEDRGYTTDNAYHYADPAMDYIAKYYVNASNGFNTVHYYKNNISFAPTGVRVDGSSQTSATANYLHTLYNEGCGWVNYSAHGYDNEWSTPNFTSSNASTMTNTNKPSIMIGNCCLSGKFNSTYADACLGEALLRRAGNAGAAAYFGATNSTYWPHDFCWEVGVRNNINGTMDASYDALHLGMYDRLFHTHNENYSAWHTSAGSINMAGNMAVEAYGSYALYYWEIYELFGDPSLMPWLGQAAEMELDHQPIIAIGSSTFTVHAAPHAYIAITTPEDHELICAAFADASGNATLQLPQDLTPGSYEIAAWAQNYKPVFEEIIVAVLDGPYVMLTQIEPTTTAQPGEILYFDLTITNVGNTVPTAGLITLSSNDSKATVIQPIARFTHCAPGDTVDIHSVCPVYLSEDLKDGDMLTFNLDVDFGPGQSTRQKKIRVSAPRITVSNAKANPQLSAATASTVTCRVSNTGSLPSEPMTLTLVNNYGFVSQVPDPVQLEPLTMGESRTVSFRLSLNENAPTTVIPFYLYATTEGSSRLVDTLFLSCGSGNTEDFESGNFSSLPWTQNSNPWEITGNAYDGDFCARSKTRLNGQQESRLNITWNSPNTDSISFYYKVSSEEGYDLFRFYIDGMERLSASGEVDWTRACYPISAGTHIISFSYAKDRYAESGSDCAWIDNISLPFSGDICHFMIDEVCKDTPYEFGEQELYTGQIGTYNYIDTTVVPWEYLALSVLDAPAVGIEVLANNTNKCYLLRAYGADTYVWSTGDTTPCIAVCPTTTAEFSVTGYRGGCSGEASTTLLSVNQADAASQVSLYPNPAHNQVSVSAPHILTVQLINVMGQVVSRQQIDSPTAYIDLKNTPKGIYFVRVETPNSTTTSKLVVQ